MISTNIGWDDTDEQRNNMGAGIALQCAQKYPGIDYWYGRLCQLMQQEMPVIAHPYHERLLFLPVKPLAFEPERSWDQEASPALIRRGLRQLRAFEGKIALSYIGAGNGKLSEALVAELIRLELGKDPRPERFTVVRWV